MKNFFLAAGICAIAAFAFAANKTEGAPAGMDCSGGVCKPVKKDKNVVASTKPEAKAATAKKAKSGCGGCATEAKAAKAAKGDMCCSAKVAKATKGCCNAAGELAKFKVFADGKYMYYGCQGSATKARAELVKMAFKVGPVQAVSGKVMIPKNQALI